MAKYAIFLEMSGRRAVVIGGGAVAVRKAGSLLDAGARVVLVADRIEEARTALSGRRLVELVEDKYSKRYLAGAVLAIAATNDQQLNRQIYSDCQELEVLCNVVDDPELCDFYVPAVVRRGDLQIAVCTDGACPAYAGHIKKKLERIFTDSHGLFLAELKQLREQLLRQVPQAQVRKAVLGELVEDGSMRYFIEHGAEKWRIFAAGVTERYVKQQEAGDAHGGG